MKHPHCRSCGKPIAKDTHRVWLNTTGDYGNTKVERLPQTIEECAKLTNHRVVHVWRNTPERGGAIYSFSWWDGESYKDEFFCTNNCAIRLGYAAARSGKALQPYSAAQEGKAA